MSARLRLLVDGVFFQRAPTGIARVWRSILPAVAREFDVLLLDRGNSPEIMGVTSIPFASHLTGMTPPSASESIAIEALCRHWRADLFASTYYSTPLTTPALQLVYDMIPETLRFDLTPRDWQEKELALLFGRGHVCISENTRADLIRFYPEIDPAGTSVAYCGVEHDVFGKKTPDEVGRFRARLSLDRPYLLMVGSRIGADGYKNGQHLFDALAGMEARTDLMVLCVGGEAEVPALHMGGVEVPVRRVTLSDADLALAYAGAEALVYPSLYEGFGMPVAEAMATGCPVITTDHGSLAEVAGSAALTVSGRDLDQLRVALREVRDCGVRAHLARYGPIQARRFNWDAMAVHVVERARGLVAEAREGRHETFLRRWGNLRRLQAEVDF